MVFIGIAGAAEPCCPADCSACASCRHPKAELRMVAASLEERYGSDSLAAAYAAFGVKHYVHVFTLVCSRCGARTTVEKSVKR